MKKNNNSKLYLTLFVLVLYFMFILFISSTSLTFVNFLCHFLFVGILIFIYRDDLKENWKEYKSSKKNILKVLLYFVIVLLLSVVLTNVVISIYATVTNNSQIMDTTNTTIYQMFDKIPWGTLFVLFLTVFYYPIVEELVFRKSLGDSLKNKVLFIIVSSLLSWYFQVTLLNPTITEFILSIGVLFNSIFASYIYSKKENILYTILPRMLYNLLICVLQLFTLFK